MDENVPGRSVDRLEPHGQSTQAGLAASMESVAVLQKGSVQVQTDVCLQGLWEPFQHLHLGKTVDTSEYLPRGLPYRDLLQLLLTAFMSMPLV